MAKQLISERAREFDPNRYKNHYAEALRNLVKEKVEGGELTEVAGGEERPAGGTVIDFMEALRRSTGKTPAKSGRSKSKTAASRQKREPAKRSATKSTKSKKRARG
jgi:DNA end-binding protein Ku